MIPSSEDDRRPAGAETTGAFVRQLAAAFRQVEDFDAFISGIEAGVGRLEFFDRAAVSLHAAEKTAGRNGSIFPAGTLCLPLSGQDRVHGTVGFSNRRRPFGPEDLHLMAGLGEMLAVLVEHALAVGERKRNLAYLDFLLNEAPAGVLCCDDEGRILVANRLARTWTGAGRESHLSDTWMARLAAALENGGEFHCKSGGRLLHVRLRDVSGPTTVKALVLSDLTRDIEQWRDRFGREICRSGWMREEFSLLLLSSPQASHLMSFLDPMREAVPRAALIGPVEVNSVALGFAKQRPSEAMEQLRSVLSVEQLEGINLGGAALNDKIRDPDDLFEEARRVARPAIEGIRPRLLLHDAYRSVNDMLEMILGPDFQVLKSSHREKSIALAEQCGIDGVIAELEIGNETSGIDLVQTVRRWNPNAHAFFTSSIPERHEHDVTLRDAIVFAKPFNVRDVAMRVRQVFV